MIVGSPVLIEPEFDTGFFVVFKLLFDLFAIFERGSPETAQDVDIVRHLENFFRRLLVESVSEKQNFAFRIELLCLKCHIPGEVIHPVGKMGIGVNAFPIGIRILRAAVGTFAESVAVIGRNRLHHIQIFGGDLLGKEAADFRIAGAELPVSTGGDGRFITGTDPVGSGNQTVIFRMFFKILFRREPFAERVPGNISDSLTEFHPAHPLFFRAVFEDTDAEGRFFGEKSGFYLYGFTAGDDFAGSGGPEPAHTAHIFQKGGDGAGIAGDHFGIFCAPEENFTILIDFTEDLFRVFSFHILWRKCLADIETFFTALSGKFDIKTFTENFAQRYGKFLCIAER